LPHGGSFEVELGVVAGSLSPSLANLGSNKPALPAQHLFTEYRKKTVSDSFNLTTQRKCPLGIQRKNLSIPKLDLILLYKAGGRCFLPEVLLQDVTFQPLVHWFLLFLV
jgi:hypothetical protein